MNDRTCPPEPRRKRRILFVHQNFPGQFRHLAPALAARGHSVTALSDVRNTKPPLPGVALWHYKSPESANAAKSAKLHDSFALAADRALRVAKAARALRERHGFVPDVIFGHPGWGETLFLKEIWPEARLIVYAEFYYASRGLDVGFDPEFGPVDDSRAARVVVRQAPLALAMAQADRAVAPTRFQAQTFPECFRPKIIVQHDGIDTHHYRPDPSARFVLPTGQVLRPGDEVLSFVARNLEPYRGFHVFMRALPKVLKARPNVQVVILGGDGVSYGTPPPAGGSWRASLLAEIAGRIDLKRVHFLGWQPEARFRALMQVTRVHCYLTVPFVLSWSLLQAMAAGAAVVAAKVPPVAEVIDDGLEGRLVSFPDPDALAEALVADLAEPEKALPRREAARARICREYDLESICLPRLVRLVEESA